MLFRQLEYLKAVAELLTEFLSPEMDNLSEKHIVHSGEKIIPDTILKISLKY